MAADLDRLLDASYPSHAVAQVDSGQLWRRGQRQRLQRRLAALAAATVVLVAVAVGATQLPGQIGVPYIGRADSAPPGGEPATPNAGEVTFEEYEHEVTRIVECLRDEGFTIEFPLEDGAGQFILGADPDHLLDWGWVSETDPDAQALQHFDAAERRCVGDENPTVQAWIDQLTPSTAERELVVEDALRCAAERGMQRRPLEEYMPGGQIDELPDDIKTELTDSLRVEQAVREYGCRPWEVLD